MEQMKLPPQAIELESAVLSSVMLDKNAIVRVLPILHTDCFYDPKNQIIWNACIELYRENDPIDIYTVAERLKKTGNLEKAGGAIGVAKVSNSVNSTESVEPYAYGIKECYLKRRLIDISTRVREEMYSETQDFFKGFDNMLNELDSINTELNRINQVSFGESLYETISEIKKAAEDKTYSTGIKSGLSALDRQTMGFQPTDLVIIAARPAMGKTALITQFMSNQAESGVKVGFFSLEMSQDQINKRMLASETNVDLKQIRRGGMHREEWQKIDAAFQKMHTYPIQVCDRGGLSINDVVGIAKNWKLKHGIDIIYLDYIQLCSGTPKKNGNREQEISEVSRRLKQLAKEIRVPVVALSQLSRSCESRADKRPMLSDLRESGAIEQDADMVIFPYRDEYYNPQTETPGETELIIAKYRNGETGTVTCKFNGATQQFTDTPF